MNELVEGYQRTAELETSEARVLRTADVVEATSSDRPCRGVLGIDKASQEIFSNRLWVLRFLLNSRALASDHDRGKKTNSVAHLVFPGRDHN